MADKREIKKSILTVIRKTILGLAIIALIICSGFLIKTYIVDPYIYALQNSDTSVTNESDTQTTEISSENIQAKYSALLKINPEFVGKLYIEAIDETGYNVVQADDNEKYLYLGFKGEETRYGTLFVDYRNNLKDLDSNTIIYGHNMRDGSQLGSLVLYADIDNYKTYPTIDFNTIYKNNKWKIFAAFITNTERSQDNDYIFPYLTTKFPSDEVFMNFIDEVKSRSYFINESIDIKPDDKILTLSTCDTVFTGARFVLMARLVRDGESEEVDVTQAKVNENQRFPQRWYDVKGESNPFADAEQFTID